jgi:hypothetical protein
LAEIARRQKGKVMLDVQLYNLERIVKREYGVYRCHSLAVGYKVKGGNDAV